MYVSLLVLGLFATAAGVAMVGFGIPINEFGLGNTLIIAGTTAIVGGLILIALAEAVRQLRRIAEGLMARPSPRVSRPNDQLDNLMSGASRNGAGTGRVSFPPKPGAEGRSRGPAPFEQRLAAAPSIEDDAPLSPQEPAHRAMDSRLGMMDFAPEPREADISRSTTDVLPISRFDVSSRPAPLSEAASKNELFESLWPAKPGKTPKVEPAPAAAQPAESQQDEPVEEISEGEAAAEPYAVSILKSGMVDGMAYTLFSDGSIEAELPQGTVRFASITELRAYLEKSS